MKQYINSGEVVTVPSYPYGSLRCTAFFSLEYNPKKGFREVFQTINPKNERLNAPKKSVYAPCIIMYRNEDGHIKYEYNRLEGGSINIFLDFIQNTENEGVLTPEQVKDSLIYSVLTCKGNYSYCREVEKREMYLGMAQDILANLNTPQNITYRFPDGFSY